MKRTNDYARQERSLAPRPIGFTSVSSPRVLALALVLTGSLSQPLWALGLGEIESSSILGQPLDARIDIVGEHDSFSIEELLVSRVSAAEAADIGIDLMSDGRGIGVVPMRTDSGWVVRVTSKRPIAEPFLNFVVKLDWPRGSVYREYTLLLDPPRLSLPVRQSDNQTPKVRSAQHDGLARHSAPASLRNPPADLYRVRIGDSLLSLAEQWLGSQTTPHSTAFAGSRDLSEPMSLEQVAQWMFDHNPQAFGRNSANSLLAGALLRFPDSSLNHDQRVIAAEDNQKQGTHKVAHQDHAQQLPSRGFAYPLGDERALMLTPEQQSLPRFALNTEVELEITAVPVPLTKARVAALASVSQPHAQLPSQSRPQSRLRLGTPPDVNPWQGRHSDSDARDLVQQLEQNARSAEDKAIEASLISMVESQLDVSHEIIEQLQRDNRDLRDQLQRLEQSDYLQTLTELVRLQGQQMAQLQAQQSQNSTPSNNSADQPLAEGVLDSIASLQSEAHAVDLLSTSPAAGGGSNVNVATGNTARLSSAPVADQLERLEEGARQRSSRFVMASVRHLIDGGLPRGARSQLANMPNQTRAGLMAIDSPSVNPNAMSDTSKPSPWLWVVSLLLPLMLIGLYLLVSIRRQPAKELATQGEAQSFDDLSFSQERICLDSWAYGAGSNFHTVDASTYFSQGQSNPSSLFGQEMPESRDHSQDASTQNNDDCGSGLEYSEPETAAQTHEASASSEVRDCGDDDHDTQARELMAPTLDSELDRVFNRAMSEIFPSNTLARQQPSIAQSNIAQPIDESTSPQGPVEGAQSSSGTSTPQTLDSQTQPTDNDDDREGIHSHSEDTEIPGDRRDLPRADNVVLFPGVRHSDEELKRRIQDKVCNYQPPKPEESGYIVQEGIEDIDRYLDIQMIETPKISLDESIEEGRKNPLDDHNND